MPINTKKLRWKSLAHNRSISIVTMPYDPEMPGKYKEPVVVVIGCYGEMVTIPESEMKFDMNGVNARTEFINHLFNTCQLFYPLEVMI